MKKFVTLHIASGVTSPQWEISDEAFEKILLKMGEFKQCETPAVNDRLVSKTGYGGFTVSYANDVTLLWASGGVSTCIFTGQENMFNNWLDVSLEKIPMSVFGAKEIEKLLLETTTVLNGAAYGSVLEDIKKLTRQESTSRHPAPIANDIYWNNDLRIRHNNCYNYACNIRTDTFAQPGRRHNVPWDSDMMLTPLEMIHSLIRSASADGAIFLGSELPDEDPRHGHYVAAMLTAGDGGLLPDYHWYRKDSDGSWSHKPGQMEVSHNDDRGNPITNITTCAHDNYPTFVGYFFIPYPPTIDIV